MKNSRVLKIKQGKAYETPIGPSSVEDIQVKMQENSIEKSGSLPKMEAKFVNSVHNYFLMTDQKATQDLQQWKNFL